MALYQPVVGNEVAARPAGPAEWDRLLSVLHGLLGSEGAVALAWQDDILGAGCHVFPVQAIALEQAAMSLLQDGARPEAIPAARHCWNPSEHCRVVLLADHSLDVEPQRLQAWQRAAQLFVETALECARQKKQITELESSKQLQRALYEIADFAGDDHEMPRLLRHFHRIVGSLIYAENCYIVEYDDLQQSLRFLYFADTKHDFKPDPQRVYVDADLPNSLTFPLLRHGEPISGVASELFERFGLASAGQQLFGPASTDWLGVPMKRGNRVCGAIVVQSYEPGAHYGDEERALLDFVSKHILAAMDRHAAHAQLERRVENRTLELRRVNRTLEDEVVERRRAERLQSALFSISELAIQCQTQEQFYREVHAVVGTLLDARNFYIALVNEQDGQLEFVYSVDEFIPCRAARPLSNGLTEYVMRAGKPLLLDQETILGMFGAGEADEYGRECHCWLGVPLFSDGEAVGAIVVQSYTEEVSFTVVDQRLLGFVGHNIGVGLNRQRDQNRLRQAHAQLEVRVRERTSELASVNALLREEIEERQRVEQRLRYLAMHDVLTGLANRLQLLEQLQQAIDGARSGTTQGFALLFLDLDRFKLVNDSMGHAAGDLLLVEVARRLVAYVSPDDVVARLGGDEFALLVRQLPSQVPALDMARQLLESLGQSLTLGGRELFPTGSIGVALWQPGYDNGEEMLRDADAAMYRAKASRVDRCLMFDEAMHEAAFYSLEVEADLRRAIANRNFVPFYQPVVSLRDGRVVGHEALLRWQHETRGVLVPADFLMVAEESGLIEQVDWLIYEQVLEGLAAGGEGYVSVNVSPRHIRSSGFLPRLFAMIERTGADPRRLRVEITEMVLLDDDARTLDTIRQLSEQGIQVQLDDFGTGYSALSYLHRFPITTLKIDRSFIAGLHAEDGDGTLMLVQGILSLARTLGIDTIAEGIETQEQLETLKALKCNLGQGYLLGYPAELAPHLKP